jgi:hypothetical protein
VKIQQNGKETFPPNQLDRLLPIVTNVTVETPQTQPLCQHVGKPLFIIDD